MSVAEKDKEYFEELDRQRKATDSFYREQIALMEKSSASIERVSQAAADWGRDDLAPWDEAKSYGKEAAAYAAASHEANEGSSFVTGEVIVGDFRRNGQSVGSQETLIAKSVRLSDRDWQNFSTGSDAVRSDIAKQHLGDVYVDGAQHGVAFNPSLNAANQNPYVVIPNKDGQIDSITQSAQKSNVTPEQKAAMASTLRQMEMSSAESGIINGVRADRSMQDFEAKSDKSNGSDAPQQSPSPAQAYQGSSLNFGHAGGSAWGGNKVAESWTLHEQKQEKLKGRIDEFESRLADAKLNGRDTAEHETSLKIAQNSYAMAEHEQAARSWSNTASYARVSQIGGMADMESVNRASFMADYHRLQVERIQEQQLELKNPEIAAQRAQEAAALQAQVEEQRRYLLEIQENNRKIQAEMGGPTTQDKINSLDQMLAGKQPEPVKAEAPQQTAEQKPAQAQVAEQVHPEPQAQQVEAPAQQQAQVEQKQPEAQVQQAEQAPQAEAPQQAAEQQPEPAKVAEQTQPEPQAHQVEAPAQQQAEVKVADANADAGTTADQTTDEQVQQQAQAEQKQPEAQVQQAEQAPQAEAPQPTAEQQSEPVKAAEQAQPEPQAQQAEVKAVDAPADAGTTADQAADEQTQQQAQVEQKQPDPQAQQAEQAPQAEAPQPTAEQQSEPVKAAEQAQPEPQAQQVEAPAQQQAEVKVADANANADASTADQAADEQAQQQAQTEQKQPEAQVQQAEQGKVAEQQANQAEHKAAVENAQGVSTARAQETGQAPQQVSAAPANSGDQVKGNEVQQVSQDQASQQASQPAAQDKGYDPHQRVRDMEAQGQAQIDKEKEQGTYQSNDQASMNSLNEQSSQAQQAQAEIAQGQQQEQGKSMSM